MRSLLLLVFFISVGLMCRAQLNRKSLDEFGLGLSVVSAYTDIGGNNGSGNGLVDFSLSAQRPGVFAFYKRNFSNSFSLKSSVVLGWLAQTDVGSRNYTRDFAFNTAFMEFSAKAIYFLFKEKEPFFYRSYFKFRRSWSRNVYPSLFVSAGVGATIYTTYPNEKMGKAINTGYEGGGTVTPVFPVGLGSTLPIARDVKLVLEGCYVFTLTDYLEGYSNPNFSNSKDMYFYINIGLSYNIGGSIANFGTRKNSRQRR